MICMMTWDDMRCERRFAFTWRACAQESRKPLAPENFRMLKRQSSVRRPSSKDADQDHVEDEAVSTAGLVTVSTSLGYQIRYAFRTFVKALAEELASHRITSSQWSALRVLWLEDGLSQVELAQRMMVEKASLTPVLAAMAESGFIKRTRNSVDRRKVNIFLTAAGRKLEKQILPLGDKINRQAVRGLSAEETRQLHTLLIKVVKNLQREP